MALHPTLRGRVSLLALAVIAGWVVILAVGLDVVLAGRLDRQIDDTLRIRAQAASATVELRANRPVGVRDSPSDGSLDRGVWVFGGARSLEHPHATGHEADRVARSLAGSSGFVDGAGRRFYALPLMAQGRRVGTVVTAVATSPYDRTEQTLIVSTVVVALLLIVGSYPVLRFAASRALRPVAAMTTEAARWSVHDPERRFGERQRYTELADLARTLDDLLDRMAAVLRHEDQLSAELSHELRTPLSRTVTSIDLMLDDAATRGLPELRADLQALRATCMTMEATIESVLATTRNELSGTVGRCDVGPVLDSFAQDGPPRVTARTTGLGAGVEESVLHRILGPVVDNARLHADAEVELAANRSDGRIEIRVVNDGPRIDAAIEERVFEPGFRGPPRDPARDYAGAGLGLALARRLAHAADGDLRVDADAAETTFCLILPSG
jgi:signal transduction histidine kinase